MSRPLVSLLQTTKKIFGIGLLLALCAFSAQAQGNFQSGSTGADGAFNPTTTQTIAVPESGVFNFTTVTIPSGVTVTFAPNSNNTPLTILASGDVVISGTINVAGKAANVNGTGGLGGPGGFAGGNGGFGVADLFSGQNGSGPGGGKGGAGGSTSIPGGGGGYATVGSAAPAASPTAIGSSYGSGLIQPLIGGSGGAGGGAGANSLGGAGGGGGGAILIASSTNITLNSTGTIDAGGGLGGNGFSPSAPGGGGSGGAIRLIANTISGNGNIRVNGGNRGTGGNGGGIGGLGYIRAEGFTLTSFTPVINQGSIPTVASLGLPNPIVLANAPEIKILSVAGINAPTNPKGTLQAVPDILVPNTQTNPVSVELEGRNLPANTGFTVTVTPSTGTPSSVTNLFTQSISPGVFTGSVQVELPAGLSVISATAIVDLLLAGIPDMVIDGEKIVKMEIKATYGQDSQISYVTDKGKRIVK